MGEEIPGLPTDPITLHSFPIAVRSGLELLAYSHRLRKIFTYLFREEHSAALLDQARCLRLSDVFPCVPWRVRVGRVGDGNADSVSLDLAKP